MAKIPFYPGLAIPVVLLHAAFIFIILFQPSSALLIGRIHHVGNSFRAIASEGKLLEGRNKTSGHGQESETRREWTVYFCLSDRGAAVEKVS